LDQVFVIKIEVVNKDGLFCWCNWHHANVLMKCFCFASTNLMKNIKLH